MIKCLWTLQRGFCFKLLNFAYKSILHLSLPVFSFFQTGLTTGPGPALGRFPKNDIFLKMLKNIFFKAFYVHFDFLILFFTLFWTYDYKLSVLEAFLGMCTAPQTLEKHKSKQGCNLPTGPKKKAVFFLLWLAAWWPQGSPPFVF